MYFNAKDFDYNIENLLNDYYKYIKESKSYKLENRDALVYADQLGQNLNNNGQNNFMNNPNNMQGNQSDYISDDMWNNQPNYGGNMGNNMGSSQPNYGGNMGNNMENNQPNYNNGNMGNNQPNYDNGNMWNNQPNYNNGNMNRSYYIKDDEIGLVRALYTEINRTLLPYVLEVLDSYEYTGSPVYAPDGITREFLAQVVDQSLRRAVEENDDVDEVYSENIELNTFTPWSRWMLLRAALESIILNEVFGVRRPRYKAWYY